MLSMLFYSGNSNLLSRWEDLGANVSFRIRHPDSTNETWSIGFMLAIRNALPVSDIL